MPTPLLGVCPSHWMGFHKMKEHVRFSVIQNREKEKQTDPLSTWDWSAQTTLKFWNPIQSFKRGRYKVLNGKCWL